MPEATSLLCKVKSHCTDQQIDRSIVLLARNRCTGCGACFNVCPVQAVTMEADKDGFNYPMIIPENCTNCGTCAQVCPGLMPFRDNQLTPECYAVWAADDVRMKSSSGGLFTLLADYVFDNGGYVCGVAFDESWRVQHRIIEKKENLPALRGSKYVQSDTGDVFRRVKDLLDDGEMVLFSGCPCEVAGLQGFLAKKYEKLTTVDIFCHCTASPGIWRKYLEEMVLHEKPEAFSFRDKESSGWRCTKSLITLKSGEKLETDLYVKGFHRSLYARESCERCQFSDFPRQGDFSIGDWWGISMFNPAFNDNKGTSLLLVNNGSKSDIVTLLKKKSQLFEPVPLEYIKGNGHINNPLKLSAGRDHFLGMIRRGVPFSKAIRAIIDGQFDVGIAGLWYGLNYGSVLTSYAIHHVVEQLGYSALHLGKPSELWESRYLNKNSFAVQFTHKHSAVSNRSHSFDELNNECSMFLVGSDTVWNPFLLDNQLPFFFLDFAASDKKKISYASSFGRGTFEVEDQNLRKYVDYTVKRLDAVSVREDLGVGLMKKEFNREAERVLDPVFLLDPEEYRVLAKDGRDLEFPGEYIFSYLLNLADLKKKRYNELIKKLGLQTVNFADPNLKKQGREGHPLEIVSKESAENWLSGIDGAKLVIADSFHAACFSIILKKDFIILMNRNSPSKGRYETLLRVLQLEDRMVYTNDDKTDLYDLALQPIDYGKVDTLLRAERDRSLAWLRNALAASPPTNEAINEELEKVSAHFRSEIGKEHAKLAKARKRLVILNALEVPEAPKEKTAKDYLTTSTFLRLGLRLDYWRCRLMLRCVKESRKKEYLDRLRSLEIASRLLLTDFGEK